MPDRLPKAWGHGIRLLAVMIVVTIALSVLLFPVAHTYWRKVRRYKQPNPDFLPGSARPLSSPEPPGETTMTGNLTLLTGGLAVAALGLCLAVVLTRWRRGVGVLIDWLMRPRRKVFLWTVCISSFIMRLGVLRTVSALPGERAPEVFGEWVFFEKTAIYPPGHGFIQQAVRFILGDTGAALAFFVCTMVVGTTLMVFWLARKAYGEKVARLAAVAIAFMPSWLLYGNLEYDLVLGALEVLLVFIFFHRAPERHTWPWLAAYGMLMGATCLVKPVALIFPGIIFLMYLGRHVGRWTALKKSAVIATFTLLTVAPWTVRNYFVFRKFVLISTNLGVILHSANNPDADGLEMMMPPTPEMTDEVEMNRIRTRMALQYIKDHPGHFMRLAGQRVVFTWGTDCSFVSTVLYDKVPKWLMNVVRGALQLPYVVAVGLLTIGMVWFRRELLHTVLHAVLFAPIAYVWALHLVCQTHPQHHLPVLPFMLILSSFVLVRAVCGPEAIRPALRAADGTTPTEELIGLT